MKKKNIIITVAAVAVVAALVLPRFLKPRIRLIQQQPLSFQQSSHR